jgi:hypothetical protein
MAEHPDDFSETPWWRLAMYPLGGAIAVLAIIGAWVALT